MMTTDIVMPNLGFDTQEGRLIEWLKQPGDRVAKGEPIAVIESDKANVELESVAEGLLLEQLFTEGTDVSVGEVIARIGREGDQETSAVVTAVPVSAAVPDLRSPSPPATILVATEKVEASPIARRLAAEHGIDLTAIKGSGPKGRIKRADVEGYLSGRESAAGGDGTSPLLALPKVRKAAREAGIDLTSAPATGSRGEVTLADLIAFQATFRAASEAPAPDATVPDGAQEVALSRVRQVIGRRLGASKREAPHFYVTGEFDFETALVRLKTLPAPQPRINDLIQFLTAQTLPQVPALNATFAGDRLLHYDVVNLAIAIAREDGLITPVIQKADRLSLTGLAAESREIIERTRANRLLAGDLLDATFTISNLGVIRQVEYFTAVINPPQVAILSVGTVKQRPIVLDGGLFIHHTVHLTLSGDHRAVDGMHLGQFMATFQEKLDRFNQGQEI
jgi:pyruvate dehydrogenase E2 component (dihydrolipoamide acetyltransferase)